MIEGLHPYSEYQESDIPWARVLPSNWQTERAKRLFTKMQRPVRPEDEVVTCFRDGRVTLRKNVRLRGFTEATAFSGYQGIRTGDLVIHGMDAFAGAIGVSDSDGKGTPVYNVCKPKPGVVASYYAHTIREMSRAQWILALAKGIRERSTDFRYETFGDQFVPLPPPDEQAAIVRFLDHANRKIDGFIRAKRKLIGLLNEQKQAIIHRAVTRGLDPNVKLKDSGIPWLGDIPQHWEVMRLKSIAKIRYGLGQPPRESETGLPLIRATNVDRGRILEKNLVRVDRADVPKTRNAFLKAGEIIVVRSGALTADSAIIPAEYEGAVAGYDMVVTVMRAQPGFIAMALLCSYVQNDQLVIASMRAAQPHLNAAELGVSVILLPPNDEQDRIVTAVEQKTSPLNTAITRTEREIALMQEYRTRLTADVVTGKLDVRAAAEKLPDLTDQPQAELDESSDNEEVEEEG